MAQRPSPAASHARVAPREEVATLVHSHSEEVLFALLGNPLLDENHLCILLERKDLPGSLLEEVARKREWRDSHPIRLRIARHPHTPRLLGIRLVRQLHLFELVNISLLPSVPAELRRIAEELILARLEQLPLGQKMALARRGSARIAAALLLDGVEQVVPLALDNSFLTEGQVLKVLSRDAVTPRVVTGVAHHRKWSCLYNVRMALVRQPLTPLARVLAFVPDLTLRDLDELCAAKSLSPSLRKYLRHEVATRSRGGRGAASRRPR
jgi:hypothetical protein